SGGHAALAPGRRVRSAQASRAGAPAVPAVASRRARVDAVACVAAAAFDVAAATERRDRQRGRRREARQVAFHGRPSSAEATTDPLAPSWRNVPRTRGSLTSAVSSGGWLPVHVLRAG